MWVYICQGDKMKVTKGRGYVCSIQYHVVWCVKYRYKVLMDDIEKDLTDIIKNITKDNHINILEMNMNKDHIHILIDCSPQHYIPNMIKALKGVSARLLFKQHPELKAKLYKGSLWNPSYFVATVSENTKQQVTDYIRSQQDRS